MSRQSHNSPHLRERRRSLRAFATPAEKRLWTHLRRRQADGWRWRRQYSVGPYILDFFCPAARLAVELDGRIHDDPARASYDYRREVQLREEGITVVRLRNDVVMHQIDLAVEAIRYRLRHSQELDAEGFDE